MARSPRRSCTSTTGWRSRGSCRRHEAFLDQTCQYDAPRRSTLGGRRYDLPIDPVAQIAQVADNRPWERQEPPEALDRLGKAVDFRPVGNDDDLITHGRKALAVPNGIGHHQIGDPDRSASTISRSSATDRTVMISADRHCYFDKLRNACYQKYCDPKRQLTPGSWHGVSGIREIAFGEFTGIYGGPARCSWLGGAVGTPGFLRRRRCRR